MGRRCSSCGAVVVVPAGHSSARCSFCDSSLVDAEGERPIAGRLLPFERDRHAAAEAVRRWLAGRWLAPESLRRAGRPETLRACFVPFHAFDATARSHYRARVGLYWYETRTVTTTENGRRVTRTERVRHTEWHPLEGEHGRRWNDHLVSASRGLPEEESNALEPFDLGRSLPFAPALVAGVEAELPSVERTEAERVALEELQRLEARAIAQSHLPGDCGEVEACQTSAEFHGHETYLLPVWVAASGGPQRPIRVLVNGQTGKVVGKAPLSPWKVGCLVVLGLMIVGLAGLFLLSAGGLAAWLEAR